MILGYLFIAVETRIKTGHCAVFGKISITVRAVPFLFKMVSQSDLTVADSLFKTVQFRKIAPVINKIDRMEQSGFEHKPVTLQVLPAECGRIIPDNAAVICRVSVNPPEIAVTPVHFSDHSGKRADRAVY